MFSKALEYDAPGLDLLSLVNDLKNWYEAQGLTVQVLDFPDGIVIQCRRSEKWRKWVGMNSELTAALQLAGTRLRVQVGPGKWLAKAGAGSAGVVMMATPLGWALMASAAYGGWEQTQLRNKTVAMIEQAVSGASGNSGEVVP